MALSQDEQRQLAEIERGLAGEDPLLAARLSAFKHPGIGVTLRLRRARLLASVASVIAVAVISVVAYLFVPFAHRAAPSRSPSPGAPAVTDTGARGSPATPQNGHKGNGVKQSAPGTSIRPASSSSPATGFGLAPGTGSGAAGSSQHRAAAGSSKAGAPSPPGPNQAGPVWPDG